MDYRPQIPEKRGHLGCAWIAVTLTLVTWVGLVWMGYSLWSATQARVPDSPYLAGQWRHYVGLPMVAAALASIEGLALWRWRRLAIPVVLFSMILMFAVLAFLLSYTGGV